jgi:hypothetical protein
MHPLADGEGDGEPQATPGMHPFADGEGDGEAGGTLHAAFG